MAPDSPPPARFYAARRYVAGDSVGWLLHAIVVSMRRRIEQRMAVHGLTAAQWLPLWWLKSGGPATARELARGLDIDAGAMTRLIDRLVAKGLVGRGRDGADRRVVRLSLTDAGDAVAARLPAVLAEVNNDYLRGFDEAEWRTLTALLRRMLDNGRGVAGSAERPQGRPAPRPPTVGAKQKGKAAMARKPRGRPDGGRK